MFHHLVVTNCPGDGIGLAPPSVTGDYPGTCQAMLHDFIPYLNGGNGLTVAGPNCIIGRGQCGFNGARGVQYIGSLTGDGNGNGIIHDVKSWWSTNDGFDLAGVGYGLQMSNCVSEDNGIVVDGDYYGPGGACAGVALRGCRGVKIINFGSGGTASSSHC
jgi:hypothetical protein